ncbi:MAG: hypothetical protein MUF05_02220 [Candidatus Omnitrophica bacterium]|jgi:hypothetical protein|nr:hypothetical protein [Candidatus Omnitrophota bacterium]
MEKKDIYEHLAKIYLDASLKKNKKKKNYSFLKNIFFFSIAIILIVGVFFTFGSRKAKNNTQIALVLQEGSAKINFHFDPAEKETYTINLNRLNVTKYKSIAFALKKNEYTDTVNMKVEMSNSFKENSLVYLKDIPRKWQEYNVNLSEFKNISDWTEMSKLNFTVEAWNTKSKTGVVLVDNVRFIK